jgi:hypothetical protein
MSSSSFISTGRGCARRPVECHGISLLSGSAQKPYEFVGYYPLVVKSCFDFQEKHERKHIDDHTGPATGLRIRPEGGPIRDMCSIQTEPAHPKNPNPKTKNP